MNNVILREPSRFAHFVVTQWNQGKLRDRENLLECKSNITGSFNKPKVEIATPPDSQGERVLIGMARNDSKCTRK